MVSLAAWISWGAVGSAVFGGSWGHKSLVWTWEPGTKVVVWCVRLYAREHGYSGTTRWAISSITFPHKHWDTRTVTGRTLLQVSLRRSASRRHRDRGRWQWWWLCPHKVWDTRTVTGRILHQAQDVKRVEKLKISDGVCGTNSATSRLPKVSRATKAELKNILQKVQFPFLWRIKFANLPSYKPLAIIQVMKSQTSGHGFVPCRDLKADDSTLSTWVATHKPQCASQTSQNQSSHFNIL